MQSFRSEKNLCAGKSWIRLKSKELLNRVKYVNDIGENNFFLWKNPTSGFEWEM